MQQLVSDVRRRNMTGLHRYIMLNLDACISAAPAAFTHNLAQAAWFVFDDVHLVH